MGYCSYCVHVPNIYLSFAVYCVIFTSAVFFSLLHSHTFSLSFCHNSKYPVGPGCRLLVLVYLVRGSIQLQAEASHSSQSHKMWLVLTTALQGDRLIGLIVSDRLGWTCYRKKTATACCGFCHFLPFSSSVAFYLLFHLPPPPIFVSPFFSLPFSINTPSVLMFSCLRTVSLNLSAHTLHCRSQTSMPILSGLPFSHPVKN